MRLGLWQHPYLTYITQAVILTCISPRHNYCNEFNEIFTVPYHKIMTNRQLVSEKCLDKHRNRSINLWEALTEISYVKICCVIYSRVEIISSFLDKVICNDPKNKFNPRRASVVVQFLLIIVSQYKSKRFFGKNFVMLNITVRS